MPGTKTSGGRNRRSRKAHTLTNTYRPDRHGPKPGTPAADPPSGRPTAPPSLAGDALAEWRRMVQRLEDAKTLSTIDDAALYQYCCLFGETEAILVARRENAHLAKQLQTTITRLEEILAADRGPDDALEINFDVDSALVQLVQLKKLDAKFTQQLRQGHMALRQYLVEFGMTPAARARVEPIAATDGEDKPTSKLAQLQAQATTLRRPVRVK